MRMLLLMAALATSSPVIAREVQCGHTMIIYYYGEILIIKHPLNSHLRRLTRIEGGIVCINDVDI